MILVEIALSPPSEVILVFVPPQAVIDRNKKPEPLKIENILQNPEQALKMFIPNDHRVSKLGMQISVSLNEFKKTGKTIGDTYEIEV